MGWRSAIWGPEKTYSGSRILGSKSTGSRIRNTGFDTDAEQRRLDLNPTFFFRSFQDAKTNFLPEYLFSLLPIVGAFTLVLNDKNLLRSHITVENRGFIFYILLVNGRIRIWFRFGSIHTNIYGSGTRRSNRIWNLEYCLKPLADFLNCYPFSLPGRRYVDPDLGAHTPRRIFDAVVLGSHLHKD